jgi:hypothetical protein
MSGDEEATAGMDDTNDVVMDDAGDDSEITFVIPGSGDAPQIIVRPNTIQDISTRELVNTIIANTKQHIAAQISLVAAEPETPHKGGLAHVIMQTALGQVDASKTKNKYIGIFFDVKVAGESNSRPHYRQPPLRPEFYKRLIDMARTRKDPAEDSITENDCFFLVDGGKQGHQTELMRPFHGMKKNVKQFMLIKDESSTLDRYARARAGVGTIRLHETLYLVSRSAPVMKSKEFINYQGSTTGSVIGPIIMPQAADLWSSTWALKKQIYGPDNIIAVGGRGDDDDIPEEPAKKAKPRTATSVEPVFYHGLPESYYTEILAAFPLSAILDLTPADGALALAAYKSDVIYVGVCFTDEHKARLMNKLERSIWKAMTTDEDPIYDARLFAALRATPTENDTDDVDDCDPAVPAPKRRASSKATASKAKAKASRRVRRRTEQGAVGGEEVGDEGGNGEDEVDEAEGDDADDIDALTGEDDENA